ncbi:thioredoxin family protein [Glycomyces paridis]|uniref:Thioredoxin n=1 Tax=Glycomyces paridis TaxID=2126555 RepID=A0A4S8PPA0_9ACTN|nr:thioredoxin family protein [Glycomyces paridis]THV30164.1 hypothetical protein E9998_07275 [Glycomyces paridis]
MQFLDDVSVPAFTAGAGVRMLVFGSASDLSSQVFGRQLGELEEETQGKVAIGLLDVARAPNATAAWGVMPRNMPVQVVFKDGVMQRVLLGVRSARALRDAIEEYFD